MTAALTAPLAAAPSAFAGEGGAHATIVVRVFDPVRRDYHAWDRHEERAYRAYLAERHRRYVMYRHQRAAERRAYWRWRHDHDRR
jgi:hypothetical protein